MMNLDFIGFRCSGKSSVGKILDGGLGMDFIDMDSGIVKMKDVQLIKELPENEEEE